MALENELGVALFDRVGRRVQLTSDGRDLLQRARRLLDDVESLAERARMLKGGSTGTIRIGAPTQVIEAVLAPFAAIFRRRHPGVEVQFVDATAERLRRHIDSGDVQIGVLPVGPDPFEGPLLYAVHVTLVVPRQHRLARRRTADVAELAGEPVLLLGHQFGLRSWFDSACDAAHVKPRLVAESASPHTLVSLARHGFGVAVVPSDLPVLQRSVRVLPLVHRGVSVGRWTFVGWNPGRVLPPYAHRFAFELAKAVARRQPGHDVVRRAPRIPEPRRTDCDPVTSNGTTDCRPSDTVSILPNGSNRHCVKDAE